MIILCCSLMIHQNREARFSEICDIIVEKTDSHRKAIIRQCDRIYAQSTHLKRRLTLNRPYEWHCDDRIVACLEELPHGLNRKISISSKGREKRSEA